ncbi:MAG TPA: sulfite exporter TauE/SafE family protein [Chthonomonadales bacterium]|nr:sulfite exporter TauE/SafE family protein [Chthonomonadales bacterium]
MDPRYSLTGLLVGLLIGVTGVGGGSLMTPILILLVGIKPTVAVGSDLAYAAITKIVGGIQHRRQGMVDHRIVWQLAVGSVPGALLGVWFVHHMQHRLGDQVQHIVLRLLGIMLIVVALALFLRSTPLVGVLKKRLHAVRNTHPLLLAIVSGLLGFLFGVTSIGSGSLFGVILIVVYGLSSHKMVGTDVYHAAIITVCAAGAHVWAGNVDYALVGNLLIGSIPGVLIGSKLSSKLPDKVLRPLLASVLLASGIKMI